MTTNPQIGLFDSEAAPNAAMVRAQDALRLRTLRPNETAVLRALLSPPCLGKSKALSIAAMQQRWQMAGGKVWSDRLIKDSVKRLLEDHEVPVGSCRVPGQNGYYLIATAADAADTARPIRNEIYSMFERLKALAPSSHFVRELAGQMDMLKREEMKAQ